MKKARYVLLTALCAGLCACSSEPVKDASGQPALRNFKKLAGEGHNTLYNNGAVEIPMTTIHIIPAGPSALQLVQEMAGLRAMQSFKESLKHAGEAVNLAQAGINKSKKVAGDINQGTNRLAGVEEEVTRFGVRTWNSARRVAGGIRGASVSYAGEVNENLSDAGRNIADGSVKAGGAVNDVSEKISGGVMGITMLAAKNTFLGSLSAAQRLGSYALDHFGKGIAAVPEKFGRHLQNVRASASLDHFDNAFQRSDKWRADSSDKFTDIIVRTKGNYAEEASKPFRAAKEEMTQGISESGPAFALLKSLRWVVQGVLWDATIKPVGKLAGASLGLIAVNGVAFPALVTMREGAAVANVAVQVTWNGAASVYDVVAPTATSALAGLFSAVELVGGQVVAVGELAAGIPAAGGVYATGKVGAIATAGGGYVAGKTVQYVGAPLSTLGIKAGGYVVGVVGGGLTAATGGGMVLAGLAGEGTTQVAGKTAAVTVWVGGSAVSVTAGAALGTYELAKAVVVPSGYELGAGLVLGYGTVSQIGAQALLAVSDASYLVLSLEGETWVVYAVKGVLDNGDNLPPGALLDLKAMQKAGETFYAVPVSQEEMERLVNSVPGQLPVKPAPAAGAAPEADAAARPAVVPVPDFSTQPVPSGG